MTQEENFLLLQDICVRLPYHLIVHVEHNTCGFIETADLQVYGYEGKLKLLREDNETFCYLPIEEVKPYLRPMSSMTEEEKKELKKLCEEDLSEFAGFIKSGHGLSRDGLYMFDKLRQLDFCLSRHLDFRRLIEKGLALEAPKDMYNEKR